MVPKIIHCFWAGGPKTKLAEKCRASWEKYASDWRIVEWDVEKILATESTKGTEFLFGAIAAKQWAAVSDWVRVWALYREGGLYLDFDHELVAPIDDLMESEWVASEWMVNGGTEIAAGAGLALEKGSEFARRMLEEYEQLEFDPNRDMMEWIVPRMEKLVGDMSGSGRVVSVLKPEVMSPMDTHGKLHCTAETRGIHHYAMSWASPRRKFARWLNWHGLGFVVDFVLRRRSK